MRALAALLWLIALSPGLAAAQAPVHVFWQPGCPHCERELAFLDRLEAQEPRIQVQRLTLAEAANRRLFAQVARDLAVRDPAVPLTVVGDWYMVGYLDDDSSGEEIRRRALACLARPCADRVALLRAGASPPKRPEPGKAASALPRTLHLPLLGEVALRELSLPALTVVLAALDGFNPCAMWVLVFLIGLLLGMRDRLRMWVLGLAFLAASAAVYFAIIAAWLNMLLFVGFALWARLGIGVVALAVGGAGLRRTLSEDATACPVTAPEHRRRVLERLRATALEQRFWVSLAGIVLLALAVNVVDLLCSAGIPAVYSQVLALAPIPPWQRQAYLALYVLVFMLDDIAVFVAAMTTLRAAAVGEGYARPVRLAGSVVMLVLGALMILRPEWLILSL